MKIIKVSETEVGVGVMKEQSYPLSILQDTPLSRKKARLRYLKIKTDAMHKQFIKFGLNPVKFTMMMHEINVLEKQIESVTA